jgi:prophage DNA circulation protein
MSYIDRLRTLKYTSPKGTSFNLQFDDLSRNGTRKIAVSESPDKDLPSIQDLGLAAEKYPVEVYISGADYDKEADRFFNALREKGVAELAHPRWGNMQVIPLSFSQVEKFVDGARRAVFTIEFVRASVETFQKVELAGMADIEDNIAAVGIAVGAGYAAQYGV